MCRFFSFVGDGHGNLKFHDWEDRQKIGLNADPGPDSHTHILTRAGVPEEKQDRWSKYEYNPLTKEFTVDGEVDGHDHAAAESWVKALDFKRVIPALIVKPIIHPFRDRNPPKRITAKHLKMLKSWASVWGSVGAYSSSFFVTQYKHDFLPLIMLWEMGLVPSFDGKVWRLHGGKNAKILWSGAIDGPKPVKAAAAAAKPLNLATLARKAMEV